MLGRLAAAATQWATPDLGITRYIARRAAQLNLEGRHCLALEVKVASASDEIPKSLITEAARCFLGDPASIQTEVPHSREENGILHIDSSSGAQTYLRSTYAPDEAEQRFRLPFPHPEGIPGVPRAHPLCDHETPEGTLLGHSRGREVRIAGDDLRRHVYMVGSTGSGKSTMLATMIKDVASSGRGFGVIDPHGDLIENVIRALPEHRRSDVIYFDPADPRCPVRVNPLEADPNVFGSRSMVTDELLRLFGEWWDMNHVSGPIFETYFRNAILLISSNPDEPGTIADLARVFRDTDFRNEMIALCSDSLVRDFWIESELVTGDGKLANLSPYITSKLNRFLYNEYMRVLASARRSSVDFRSVMDDGKIFLARLSKGRLGSDGASLFGSMLVARFLMAALAREEQAEQRRADFTLFIDEAQNFVTSSTVSLLAESRKYRLSLVLANQTLGQLRTDLLDGILGNVGSLVAFRPGVIDARRLEPYFAPQFTREDLLELDNFTAAARLLVKGRPARPFLLSGLPPS